MKALFNRDTLSLFMGKFISYFSVQIYLYNIIFINIFFLEKLLKPIAHPKLLLFWRVFMKWIVKTWQLYIVLACLETIM
jgi:hypothetical protein